MLRWAKEKESVFSLQLADVVDRRWIQRIKKLWYIHNGVLLAMLFESKWMQLEDITLSEVSQAQKHKGCMFSLMWEKDPKINIYTKQA
jgi:hypothetical protein